MKNWKKLEEIEFTAARNSLVFFFFNHWNSVLFFDQNPNENGCFVSENGRKLSISASSMD